MESKKIPRCPECGRTLSIQLKHSAAIKNTTNNRTSPYFDELYYPVESISILCNGCGYHISAQDLDII